MRSVAILAQVPIALRDKLAIGLRWGQREIFSLLEEEKPSLGRTPQLPMEVQTEIISSVDLAELHSMGQVLGWCGVDASASRDAFLVHVGATEDTFARALGLIPEDEFNAAVAQLDRKSVV